MSKSDLATDTRWSYGLMDYPLLSTFACEKYVLTNNPVPFQTAEYYEFAGRYGNKYLFRNQLFLPLGLSFEYYITEDIFSQLPQWAKPVALLNAVVLSDKTTAAEPGLSRLNLDDIKYQVIETPLPDIAAKRRIRFKCSILPADADRRYHSPQSKRRARIANTIRPRLARLPRWPGSAGP